MQGIGHSLNNLGLNAVMVHDYDGASTYLRENLRVAREADYKLAIQYSLFGLGMVSAAGGQPARAARLWGAEEAMREAFGIKITPLARSTTNYVGHVATARSQLDEASFAEAWSEGHAMTTEEAVEYALAEDEAAATEDVFLTSRNARPRSSRSWQKGSPTPRWPTGSTSAPAPWASTCAPSTASSGYPPAPPPQEKRSSAA